MGGSKRNRGWIRWFITVGAGLFIVALVVSAIFEPSIRLLHALQTLIYIAVIVLTRRQSAWGFGAGCIIAAFWNYVNLFVTTFIRAGLEQVSILLHTGNLPRPDLLIAVVAAAGHFLLIIGCLAGFLRTSLTLKRLRQFIAGGSLAVGYLTLIIVLAGPQYIGLLRRIFHL